MARGRRSQRLGLLGSAASLGLIALFAALLSVDPGRAEDSGGITQRRDCARNLAELTRGQEELRIVREMIELFRGAGEIEFSAADNARNILFDMVMSSVSYFSPMTFLGRYNLARYHLEPIDSDLATDHRQFLAAISARLPSSYRLIGPMLQYGPESAIGRRHLAAAMGMTWQIAYTEDQDAFLRAALTNAEIRRDLYNRYDANPDGAWRHEAKLAGNVATLRQRREQLHCGEPQIAPTAQSADPIARTWRGNSWGSVVIETNEGGPFIGSYTGTHVALNGELILTKASTGRYVGTFKEIEDWPYGYEGEVTITLRPDGSADVKWRDKEGKTGSGEWH